MPKDRNLLELMEIYADLIERQTDLIKALIDFTKRQAIEIQQYKTLAGCEDMDQPEDAELIERASMLINEEL